ncbi:MAG: YlmC/YmxH family sporulation protein [Lachnospiraceae bacterium]|nr:YlmC/YmxH family sporulation protein [Lachnospiraceae bacterium]
MRMSELKCLEVINVCDCKRLGFVGDIEFDQCTGKIKCLIVPGPGNFLGFLGHEKELFIPFEDICQIGDDIILVEIKDRDKDKKK